jgi:PAS domain S-box-containing protein
LLLEPSDADARLIEEQLLQQGMRVEVKRLTSGAGLVGALEEFKPQLVLCDCGLPDADASAVLGIVQGKVAGLPVILVAGSVDEASVVEWVKAGASDYVVKDQLGRLGKAIQSSFERQRMVQGRLTAETALRESEERYRLMVEGSSEVFFYRHTLDNRFEYLSPSVREVLGYGPEELIGKSYTSLLTGDISDETVIRLTGDAMRYGIRGTSYLAVVRHKDGRKRTIEVTETPVLRRGKTVGMQGFGRDITERRLAEEKLLHQAGLLDLVPDAVMVVDMQDWIRFWSRGAEQLTGHRREEVLNRRAAELDYWGLGAFETARALALERGEWQGEVIRFGRDRRKVIVESRWRVVRDAVGNAQSLLVLESDITERKRIEQQLLQAQRMHSMGTLAGGIAHDLNNILSPILMAAQVLRTESADDYVRTMLETIEGCARRGADVVRQLLTFARGIQGERVSVQVRHLIKEVVQIAQETFPKTLKVMSNVPRELWPVTGDAGQIHQVILNLCVNARDAMPNGGTITVAAENVTLDDTFTSMESDARPGAHILLTVSDTGVGIDSEIVDKIFEPFFSTKQTGKNPGLGLSTVLGIVRGHGGFIRVTSRPGQGSVFKVFLPASPGAKVDAATPSPVEMPRGEGEMILVVDDEAGIRESTRVLLQRQGYEVVLAGDGAEALALFAQQSGNVRLVIADIMMPFMDGVAMVRALRRIAPDIPVIAASGLMDDRDQSGRILELQSLQVKKFLTKPFTAEELLTSIRGCLQGGSVHATEGSDGVTPA